WAFDVGGLLTGNSSVRVEVYNNSNNQIVKTIPFTDKTAGETFFRLYDFYFPEKFGTYRALITVYPVGNDDYQPDDENFEDVSQPPLYYTVYIDMPVTGQITGSTSCQPLTRNTFSLELWSAPCLPDNIIGWSIQYEGEEMISLGREWDQVVDVSNKNFTLYCDFESIEWWNGGFGLNVTVPQNISQNTTLQGNVTLMRDLTIDNGVTLTINSGLTIKLGPTTDIFANGRFNATSTTFMSTVASPTYGSWGSIVFNGPGSAGSMLNSIVMRNGTQIDILNNTSGVTIQNSTIENTINGVNAYNSSGTISGCYFNLQRDHGLVANNSNLSCYNNNITKTNNSGAAMLFSAGGNSSTVYTNDISGYNWGIASSYGAIVSLGHDHVKNNRVRSCLYGLYVYQSGSLNLSGTAYGRNSIYNNTNYNAYVYSSGNIYGSLNFWSYPVPTSKFYCQSGSYLDWSSPLQTDPWSKQEEELINNDETKKVFGATTALSKSSKNDISLINRTQSIVEQARELRDAGKKREALDLLKSYLETGNFNSDAISELYALYEEPFKSELETILYSVPETKIPLGKYLYGLITLQKGETKKAANAFDKLSKTQFAWGASLAKFYLSLYNENDLQTAEDILNGLKPKSNDEEFELNLAYQTLITYSGYKGEQRVKKEVKVKSVEIPMEYQLDQNYPNPFNPSTTISYAIPQNGLVKIIVYDVIGREVKTLVNEFKQSGRYDVKFDAASFSSGIYIYKLFSTPEAGEKSQIFTDVKKMILIK
ncbi:MAG: T9SS type A sorting domain-containing protein, partial [Bacteroidota bacterium]